MKIQLAVFLLLFVPVEAQADPPATATAAGAAPAVLKAGEMPIGSLGQPLGSYLTIEGRLDPRGEEDHREPFAESLLIDTVNGKRLEEPIRIEMRAVERLLPAGFRFKLKGYETAELAGTPPAIEEAAQERGAHIHARQTPWRVEFKFALLSDLELLDVSLASDPVAALRAALPKEFTLGKVEENATPQGRRAGRGQAIHLVWKRQDILPALELSVPHKKALDQSSATSKDQKDKAQAEANAEEAVIYIMPESYDEGKPVVPHSNEEAQHIRNAARILCLAPTAKVYGWCASGDVEELREPVIMALFKSATEQKTPPPVSGN